MKKEEFDERMISLKKEMYKRFVDYTAGIISIIVGTTVSLLIYNNLINPHIESYGLTVGSVIAFFCISIILYLFISNGLLLMSGMRE